MLSLCCYCLFMEDAEESLPRGVVSCCVLLDFVVWVVLRLMSNAAIVYRNFSVAFARRNVFYP